MRAVICDDDAVVRSVVTSLLEARGGEVLAEADNAANAIALIDRFEPDLLVLDMSLAAGAGSAVLLHLRARGSPCPVIVFTAYRPAERDLEGIGVRLVDKPDFAGLEQALDETLRELTATDEVPERRREHRELPVSSFRTEAGLDDPSELYRALATSEAGDAILAIQAPRADAAELGRAARKAVRAQDRIALRRDTLVILLVSGGADGAAAVLRRLGATHPDAASSARTTVLDNDSNPMDALD